MSILLVAVVALLLLAGVGLGLAVSWNRQIISDDYFLAGRSLPWYALALTGAGAGLGLQWLLTLCGVGYANCLASALLLWVLLPFLFRKKLYTTSELLGRRYSRGTRGVFSVLVLLYLVLGVLVPALFAGGWTLCKLAFDRPPEQSLWLIAAIAACTSVVAAYVAYGGLSAVVWAGVLQTVVLLIAATRSPRCSWPARRSPVPLFGIRADQRLVHKRIGLDSARGLRRIASGPRFHHGFTAATSLGRFANYWPCGVGRPYGASASVRPRCSDTWAHAASGTRKWELSAEPCCWYCCRWSFPFSSWPAAASATRSTAWQAR